MRVVILTLFVFATTHISAAQADALGAPTYDPSPDHLWNRLNDTLFTRALPDGHREIHTALHALGPLIYPDSNYLFKKDAYPKAIAVLDEFLNSNGEKLIADPSRRLLLQHDLWAAFDALAWVRFDSFHLAEDEPAAIALRARIAKIIKRLAFSEKELKALPDNFAAAAKLNAFPTTYDPAKPAQSFFPADLFDENGPWVRYHNSSGTPNAIRHVESVDGRSAFILLMRLPGGRDATKAYLKGLKEKSFNQFPEGTMVALVRRAFAIDEHNKLRLTPLVESVQIRVYRTISANPNAVMEEGNPGIQDMTEFLLDRAELFSGKPGLKALLPEDEVVGFGPNALLNDRAVHVNDKVLGPEFTSYVLKSSGIRMCAACHQQPGIYSVDSIARSFRSFKRGAEQYFSNPYTYDAASEGTETVSWKYKRYNWGLLQGLLEAQ